MRSVESRSFRAGSTQTGSPSIFETYPDLAIDWLKTAALSGDSPALYADYSNAALLLHRRDAGQGVRGLQGTSRWRFDGYQDLQNETCLLWVSDMGQHRLRDAILRRDPQLQWWA